MRYKHRVASAVAGRSSPRGRRRPVGRGGGRRPGFERLNLCTRFEVESGRFVLSTFHRPENVDEPDKYRAILEELVKLPIPVLLPLHPRSVRRASEHGLADLLDRIRVTEPTLDDIDGVHAGLADLASPYGDGTASLRSLQALARRI